MTNQPANRTISSAMRAADELAHYAGRPTEDPGTLLAPTLRCLEAVSALLHEVAEQQAAVSAPTAGARISAYQVVWELHRAGEMAHQIAGGVGRAIEALPTQVTAAATVVQTPRTAGLRVTS